MLPILAEDLVKIEGAGFILALIVFHNCVDQKLNTEIKRRVTHDYIREGPSQQSINSICVESEMESTILDFFFLIILNQIHALWIK